MTCIKNQRIVILGGGFAGLYVARVLEHALQSKNVSLEVTLIDKENFFLFTPMLHETVSSTLGGVSIANPLRKFFKKVRVLKAEVVDVDLDQKNILIRSEGASEKQTIPYDQVIFALGAVASFFGMKNVERKALPLKSLHDGIALRNRVLSCLELAHQQTDIDKKRRFLTFVVAGGGFTGVETLGAVDDLIQEAMALYPRLSHEMVRMVLVHPGQVLLPEMDSSLGLYVQRAFEKRGMEIKLGTKVVDYQQDKIVLSNAEAIDSPNIIWAAGNVLHPVVASLPFKKEKGRLLVNEYFQVPETQGVWALGDCAYIPDSKTQGAHPPTAQHATREACVLGENLLRQLNHQPLKPFSFRTLGQMANIGRYQGAANIFGIRITGVLAWLLWRDIYWWKLPRLEKKFRVAFSWCMAIFFKKDTVQFLTSFKER